MLFTRDLRLHDNPALTLAAKAEHVVPLFVFDDRLLSRSPNRTRFLLDALDDLADTIAERGGRLVLRRGDPAEEAVRLARQAGAEHIYLATDVSDYAARRRATLRESGVPFTECPGVTVVPPDDVKPGGGDHYKVFTPYWRAWSEARWRSPAKLPGSLTPPDVEIADHVGSETIARAFAEDTSPGLVKGGETEGRRLVHAWLKSGIDRYDAQHDALAADDTSHVSAYLRFGCVSPLELAQAALKREGGDPYARQLAWRDFYYQVGAAFPRLNRDDYRSRDRSWTDDDEAYDAWREGRTGYPIVDAGMRQLREEGWMHNRARLVTGSFLTRNLKIHWRRGLAHFDRWLVDGDFANNAGNWQWVAGTGNDTRPNRVMNPLRQSARFDKDGAYIRRYVPELKDADAALLHKPWDLDRDLGYPPPIAELTHPSDT
ncbi:cryptochrome/photolyase family protein [Actinomadura flavalba]|uniref:cryptochrome/photolyase family protein n=1 Tax=Actinomadura flavalba TaxID=1120938 RepID=UPI001F0A6955|nr:deoxyribodipyrimidine photo-lyase [Actinomadura flavalba]